MQQDMSQEEITSSSNMALVKSSGEVSGSGAGHVLTTSGGNGTPVMQCYTVTKKTTTTTYGDEEGDEGREMLVLLVA